MSLIIIPQKYILMTFNAMKKSIFLMCALWCCIMCFSQQQVKVFGIDFSHLTMRQAAFSLKPKFYPGKVTNTFEFKYPSPDDAYHEICGNLTYAGYENCFALLWGNYGKPNSLSISINGDNRKESEIMLKLSNAIREKYGVSPEKSIYNNKDQYTFRIGNTTITIYQIWHEGRFGSQYYGWYTMKVIYTFEQSTSVNSNDI